MGRARDRKIPLLRLVRGLVRNGGMQAPDWLPIVTRYPPPPIPRIDRDKIPILRLPQDRLANIYMNKRDGAIDPSTAMEFANEQMVLIEEGISEQDAYQMLIDKYEKVEDNRFLNKVAHLRGIEFADPEEYTDIFDEWKKAESDAIKTALRLEYAKIAGPVEE